MSEIVPRRIELYVMQRPPPIYLHVMKVKDTTLLCVDWRHVVMDAGGTGSIVKVWKRHLSQGCQSAAKLLEIGSESDNLDPTHLDHKEEADHVYLDLSWKTSHSFKCTS